MNDPKKAVVCPTPKNRRPIPSPFRYPGSKKTVMRPVVSWLPPHDVCVDVFGGTGAMLLSKPRSKLEVFNDLNEDLINAFAVLQDDSSRRQLFRRLTYTPHSRAMFEQCVGLLKEGTSNPVERAWAYFVIGNQARAGVDPSLAMPFSWGYQRKFGAKDRWLSVQNYLNRVAARFRGVQIENRPWEKILDLYDSYSSLFMLDPPYPHCVRVAKKLYKHEMAQPDHERLLQRVQQLKGLAIICSYDNALYRAALAHWRRIEIKTRCLISPAKPHRTEIVWMNYEFRPVSQPQPKESQL